LITIIKATQMQSYLHRGPRDWMRRLPRRRKVAAAEAIDDSVGIRELLDIFKSIFGLPLVSAQWALIAGALVGPFNNAV
jgi:hypothetical protein